MFISVFHYVISVSHFSYWIYMHPALHVSCFMHMDGVMQTATLTPLNKNIPNVIFRGLCDKTGMKRYLDDKKIYTYIKIQLTNLFELQCDFWAASWYQVLTDTNLIKWSPGNINLTLQILCVCLLYSAWRAVALPNAS